MDEKPKRTLGSWIGTILNMNPINLGLILVFLGFVIHTILTNVPADTLGIICIMPILPFFGIMALLISR